MKKNNGITLIALIITIIVMLILVAVTIRILINDGLIGKAKDAGKNTQSAYEEESKIGDSLNIDGVMYNSIDEYIKADDENPIEVISKTDEFIGFYANLDDDPEPEGYIFADLAFSKSGQWNESGRSWADGFGTFSYDAIDGNELKEYYISQKDYNGPYGTKDVLTATGSGMNRFYIMALENAGNSFYCWYDSSYTYGMSDYATTTSNSFGTGRANTMAMIDRWNNESYGTQNNNGTYSDLWGVIQEEANAGWFVPSREEFAALGYNLGILPSNYEDYGLGWVVWTSSQSGSDAAWLAYLYGSCCIVDRYFTTNGNYCSARLCKTF